MSKSKTYSNIQNVEERSDRGHPCDLSNSSSPRREDTDGTVYGEPFVDSSLSSKVPGITVTTSPRGDPNRLASPISPGNDIARSITMPDGLSRFRKAAQTAIQARRMSKFALREQGVDASDMDSIFSGIEASRIVDVTTVDMSQTRYRPTKGMNNQEFLDWLKQPRPEWSKVRWININGMSWDVIKEISLTYDLHQLAVEDLLHVPQRTKVDIYPKQTYIACMLLTLMEILDDGELKQVDPTVAPHGLDPELLSKRIPLERLEHYKYRVPRMQAYGALRVQMEQVTIFLLEDSTLITLFQVSGESVVNPIVERLAHDYNIARKQNDASFLLQSVIDGIVDHAIPITDAFRQEINELETHVLAMPRMRFTRDLHRMTAQLSMMKRTLAPTQSLVHALRGKDARSPLTNIAKTYMGDVMDHCNTMVEDIDSMLALCEKLINMIFNLIAYDTNESMRRLAIVSIIFLPITFVAGVYGTNFEDFPELKHNISYFWIICGVVTAVVVMFIAGEWLFNEWKASSVEKRLNRREPVNIQRPGHEHRRKTIAIAVPLVLLRPWDKSSKNLGINIPGTPPDLLSPTQPITPSSDNSAKANSYTPALDQPFDYANGAVKMRGVNLGGWLVLEPFITPSLFDPYVSAGVVDEYTLCKHLGPDASRKLLENHYASWVTENTFMRLQDLGLNHVRIPIGFWALGDLAADEPYVPKVAWNYLLRAIEWARKYGIRVMVELHAAPGSQNGWNHSGRSGLVNWLNGTMGSVNAQRTVDYVQQLTTFFADPAYMHVGPIMGMLNEPAAYELGAEKVMTWYRQAFNTVRQATGAGRGPWMVIHDGFLGLEAWYGFMPKADRLMIDAHQYIMFNIDLMKMTSTAQLQFACSTWGAASTSSTLEFGPTMVGEFSVAVNDCAKYLNGINSGSRWEGTFGDVRVSPTGGSCASENDASKYSSTYKQFLRNFFEAQVEAFEQGAGWFFWNFKTESNPLWSYFDGVDQGWIPKDANNRGPGFCVANGFSLN
ncbi:hypothetical protein BGZ93_004495 [Podila epicladia]|nr:hypothetical protein BGZ93_004495 [Podila epicladia]